MKRPLAALAALVAIAGCSSANSPRSAAPTTHHSAATVTKTTPPAVLSAAVTCQRMQTALDHDGAKDGVATRKQDLAFVAALGTIEQQAPSAFGDVLTKLRAATKARANAKMGRSVLAGDQAYLAADGRVSDAMLRLIRVCRQAHATLR